LAVKAHRKALATRKGKLGPDDPHTLGSMNNLAMAYQASGQLAEAVTLFKAALEKLRTKLGPDHSETLTTMKGFAGMKTRETSALRSDTPA
jgi:hypothetical protein